MGELINFAVDCGGNGLPWEMQFGFHIIKSFATSQRSHREAFNRKLDRMMKRKKFLYKSTASNLHGQ